MANADLTAQRLRELLHYDPKTGVFRRLVKRKKWHVGTVAGSIGCYGYVIIGLDYSRYAAHRLAWLHFYGEWPDGMLDHINGNRADNRISNLRAASTSVNSQNQRLARRDNKSSGLLGVNWHAAAKKWRAKLKIGTKYIHIGLYDSPEEAHEAYVEAKRIYHAGCTF